MNTNKKSTRSWWRGLFVDHPGFTNKDPDAYTASGTGVTKSSKIYCVACLPVDTQMVLQEDYKDINQGRISVARDQAVIEAYRE